VTYSIVARDSETGQLGVAVQSHWFAVGPIVPWARPGVGAVATQANAQISYGPKGLDLMAAGRSAPEALEQLLGEDPEAATRQVAMVDAAGAVAVHTGESAVAFAGHVTGEAVSCQANIMVSARVWPAMLDAYGARAREPFGERLMAALDAAEAEGGDARGRQSAAILIVPAEGEPWDAVVRLHVEDHPDPLPELHRLLRLNQAYELANQADEFAGQGRHDEAAEAFQRASQLAPGNHELLFWSGLGAAQGGQLEMGVDLVRQAIEMHPGWRELLDRLPDDLAPSAPPVREALKT
jgi:uncharacterized Ntn-hydrolase superfamily protein